ncbi:MAG: O-antigen ligase family protein [Nocardioidaceae bacterium]
MTSQVDRPAPAHAPALQVDTAVEQALPAAPLPRWPMVGMFGLFPLWWALGCVDMMLFPMAVVMLLYLRRRSALRAPRGFGLWLFFLAWSAVSVIELDSALRIVGFGYRLAIYLSCTVLFLYVHNGRDRLSARFVAGLAVVFWATTIVGGFLGLFFPKTVIRTPLSYVLPGALTNNELVNQMVIRRFAQYNPDSYFQIAPRPSAPFLYTNNWGNVFSLLFPLVIAYLVLVRRERRFLVLALAVPIGFVPAVLTLNRGMFLGLAVSLAYISLRLALLRHARAILGVTLIGVLAVVAVLVLPVGDRLDNRLENSATNESRTTLYGEVLKSTADSPLFGMGAPRPAESAGNPPVGTQGQLWLVLYSHGPAAVVGFFGWFLVAFIGSLRRRDAIGLAVSCMLLVGLVEFIYYGLLPYGLPLLMIAAGLALRSEEPTPHAGLSRAL